jgi:hypothetical protein
MVTRFACRIGNSDMHSGNLALFVDLMPKPRLSLAPAYDMLPMRWRPDATLGAVPHYSPFELDAIAASSPACAVGHEFWGELAGDARVSKKLRSLAKEMTARMANRGGLALNCAPPC